MCVYLQDSLVVLLSRYSNVDVLDGVGRSPLYLASHAGQAGCVKLLLEQGAHVARSDRITGRTSVHAAASQVADRVLLKGETGKGTGKGIKDGKQETERG